MFWKRLANQYKTGPGGHWFFSIFHSEDQCVLFSRDKSNVGGDYILLLQFSKLLNQVLPFR